MHIIIGQSAPLIAISAWETKDHIAMENMNMQECMPVYLKLEQNTIFFLNWECIHFTFMNFCKLQGQEVSFVLLFALVASLRAD